MIDFDAAFAFVQKVMAIPELHAVILSTFVGFALAYVQQRGMREQWSAKLAKHYGRLVIAVSVMAIAYWQIPTPRMAAWALGIGLLSPQWYEWLTEALYHHYPWLKPPVLTTRAERLQNEIDRACGD